MTEETKAEIVPAKPSEIVAPPMPGLEMIVLARDPTEMAKAQAHLALWAENQSKLMQLEIDEASENIEIAKKAKYRLSPWKTALARAEKRKVYYDKIGSALKAGFFIIPDFPSTVIAVRTKSKQPNQKVVTSKSWGPQLPDVPAQELPVGIGEYVSPDAKEFRWETKKLEKNWKGEETQVTIHHAKMMEFDAVDFPFHTVRPQVLSETNRAMLLKIFDEIKVLPQQRSTKKLPDPIVSGTIIHKPSPNNVRRVNFLIYWWIDTRDL